MNIFIIHSGADLKKVEEIKRTLVCDAKYAKVLVLENGGKFWKIEAKQLLKQSQLVLLIVGENSYKSKNIGWELEQAKKHHKYIMYYKINEANQLPPVLINRDSFTHDKTVFAVEAHDMQDVVEKVIEHEEGNYPLFNQAFENMNNSQLLEQYKIFLSTSENLVARRQTVNNFYISTNAAVITLFSLALSLSTNVYVKFSVIIALSLIGIILDYSWNNVLDSYGVLNSSKMKVISMIEKQLPVSLYDTEWTVMSDKLNSKRYVSFTDSEKRIPRIFGAIYLVSLISSMVFLLITRFAG